MKKLDGNNAALSPIYGVIMVLLAMVVLIVAWAALGDIPDTLFNSVNGSSAYDPDAVAMFDATYSGYRYLPLLGMMAFGLFIFVFAQWVG